MGKVKNFILDTYELTKDVSHPLHGISVEELVDLMSGYDEWITNND